MSTDSLPDKQTTAAEAFLPGLNNLFFFAVFNALSFQMVLGSPMVLYAKSLGANSTVLGIIAGMMPLLVIFQIPAANHIARIGYKKFLYAGWGLRVLCIFTIALVPLTSRFMNRENQLALLMVLLFTFNLMRGISSAAWLPWITSLVQSNLRGRYLAREAAFVSVGSFIAFLIAAFCLGDNPDGWQFAALFGFSGLAGATSLNFLKRIPEVQPPEQARASNTPVPWKAMLGYLPFRKLLWLTWAWSMAIGGLTTFVVLYLKTETAMTEREILGANSAFFLGGLSSLWLLGSGLDRFGSKPVITFSLVCWLLILACWTALAGKFFPLQSSIVWGLQFFMGLAGALVSMATTRLAMALAPEMGRSHFFVLFSVIGSVTLGISPILWGLMIDALRGVEFTWLSLAWNQFSLFFTAVGVVFALALALTRRLDEPTAQPFQTLLWDILVASPQRFWIRVWPRL